MIKKDMKRISKPLSNPAAGLLADTIDHFEISQSKAARGMGVARSILNEVINGKRGVSTDLALRAEAFFGLSAELILDLQHEFDFQTAYHEHSAKIKATVQPITEIAS